MDLDLESEVKPGILLNQQLYDMLIDLQNQTTQIVLSIHGPGGRKKSSSTSSAFDD